MDDEWYDGYDGGMYSGSGSGTKGLKRKTRIPRFKSIIRKGYRGSRSRRGKVSDSETTIVMLVVITSIVSALLHTEWIFASLYALFVLYTLLTKDVWPIRFVSVVLTAMGILFFVALGLAVLLNLMVDHNILKHPATQMAYGYIIKIPLLSWSIIWLLENWIVWINKREFAKANFVEKDKLLLQKLTKLCFTASMVLLIFGVVHYIYTVYSWGFWGLQMFSIIRSWTTPLIIGITMLGKFLHRLANK